MKIREPFLLTVLLGCFSLWAATETSIPVPSKPFGAEAKVQNKFIHAVFFWLKPGTPEEARQKLITDCRDLLGKIPTVRFLAAGTPAGTPRDVVDNSFGVGLVVHFDDREGHDFYQEASEHQLFIERNQAIWERVQVFDMIGR